jgi:cytochrome c oxidase cbb3-type subunit I/II
MVVAVTAYGMATFEGPMLSIKSVNAISHFTDWTIGHVHIGTLGMEWIPDLRYPILDVAAAVQHQAPLDEAGQRPLLDWHPGDYLLCYSHCTVAGWTQHLMWKQFTPDGSCNTATSWKL